MGLFHHEAQKNPLIVTEANNFFFAVKQRLGGDPVLPVYYYLSLNLILEVANALTSSNPLKNHVYFPISYLYSEIALLLRTQTTTHNDLLRNIGKNDIGKMTTHANLEKIKEMHKGRLHKIPSEITQKSIMEIHAEVQRKENTLDGWWGKAYVQEKEPAEIEEIWQTKGKKEVCLSVNCSSISIELLGVIKKVHSQQEYLILQGEEEKRVRVTNNNHDLNDLFARYYVEDKFLDYAAFLFEDPYMIGNVLSRYS